MAKCTYEKAEVTVMTLIEMKESVLSPISQCKVQTMGHLKGAEYNFSDADQHLNQAWYESTSSFGE